MGSVSRIQPRQVEESLSNQEDVRIDLIDNLPVELFQEKILSLLRPQDLVTLALTCRKCKQLLGVNYFWKNLFTKTFTLSTEADKQADLNYKDLYFKRLEETLKEGIINRKWDTAILSLKGFPDNLANVSNDLLTNQELAEWSNINPSTHEGQQLLHTIKIRADT